ncbi:MAG TPA: hypothetical protein DCZ38_03110 [Coxiellaceae bacterium]|nr:MAG: hypothetical protein A2V89_02185 [Gammaproteobacteria bacterium RBG_16_37_9]HBC71751.1 hypothetical protein [Coxiellaceae bacterium]
MKFIDNLLLRYAKFRKKMDVAAKEAETREEERNKKYYLDNYGAYHNADKLSHREMLEVFWRVLKDDYDVSNFNGNTSVREPAKQGIDWDDLGAEGFLIAVYRMFDFSEYDFTDDEYDQIKTFGEIADLVIRKAKEKKLKQNDQ